MKTMQNYTIYCTEEQTRRAWKLGAPLEKFDPDNSNGVVCEDGKPYAIPTTQQMIGWLHEEKGVRFNFIQFSTERNEQIFVEIIYEDKCKTGRIKNEQAERIAIDTAFDYLEKI